jgi:hypothetical protein
VSKTIRRRILRANGLWLLIGGTGGLLGDIAGAFFGRGPQSMVLGHAPETVIGSFEAHGLALIIGVLLLRAAPLRSWHLTGAAVHLLLGGSNILFWQIFITAGALAVGYVSTTVHVVFVALQLIAAAAAWRGERGSEASLAMEGARP